MSSDELTTRPSIEAVLQRINDLRELVVTGFSELNSRLARSDERLEEIETRLDQLEGLTYKTRSEFVYMRADLKEWQQEIKKLIPSP